MSVDLRSRYLGLELKHPIVASASPLTSSVDSLRRLEDAGVAAVVLDTPNFRSTNGRVWRMELDPNDPTVVTSLTVFVEGDDNPVQTLNEVHQPDNIESTTSGILLTEDTGSSQQFPVGSTDPNATTARLWYVPFSGSPQVVAKVDQSAMVVPPTWMGNPLQTWAPGNPRESWMPRKPLARVPS